MIKKSDDLLFIEQCFTHIKGKHDIDGNIKRIERALSRILNSNYLSWKIQQIHFSE